MHKHKKVMCSCGTIISQCRCVSKDIPTIIIRNGCPKCKEGASHSILDIKSATPLTDREQALKNGNTRLLTALMYMCHQNLATLEDQNICVSSESASEDALDVLVEAGVAERIDDSSCVLLWEALLSRIETQ